MKFWVTLEGRETEVEFRTEGGTLLLEMDGRTIAADFHRLPDGEVYSLLVDGRSHEVRVSPGESTLEVSVHGSTVPVEVRHPLEKMIKATHRAGPGSGIEVVTAPMPGLVAALRVKLGDAIAAGAAVVVIEAMKMQNDLVARHAGVVSEILVAERAAVAAGQPLVRLKSTP